MAKGRIKHVDSAMVFGEKVPGLVASTGLGQREFCDKYGITEGWLKRLKAGKEPVTLEYLVAFTDAVNIKPEEIIKTLILRGHHGDQKHLPIEEASEMLAKSLAEIQRQTENDFDDALANARKRGNSYKKSDIDRMQRIILDRIISGIKLIFRGQLGDPLATELLKKHLHEMIDRIAAKSHMAIDKIEEGSVVLTMTMGERDAISLTHAFAEGRLDDLELFRIDFTKLTPKLEAAIAQVGQATGGTRISRTKRFGRAQATLSREITSTPDTSESADAEKSIHTHLADVSTPSPAKHKWRLPKRSRLIPSDQIGIPSPGRRRAFEYAVAILILIIAVLVATPAISAMQERAARLKCANNLRLLSLASQNYHDTHGAFPSGSISQLDTLTGKYQNEYSCFVRLLPFMEHNRLYNEFNFNLPETNSANSTASTTHISVLDCPKDAREQLLSNEKRSPKDNFYSSYAGCQGVFGYDNCLPTSGVTDLNYDLIQRSTNGVIFSNSAISKAHIIDGTGNTFMFGEHVKSDVDTYCFQGGHAWFRWSSGSLRDTQFSTMYPLNPLKTLGGAFNQSYSFYLPTSASSEHRNGANFAFCDGSVRFISNTINSWKFLARNQDVEGNALPDGIKHNHETGVFHYGGAIPGIYQALSTRNGGESIPPDSF